MIPSDFSSSFESNLTRSFGLADWTSSSSDLLVDRQRYNNSAKIYDREGAYYTTIYWSSENPLSPEELSQIKKDMVGYSGSETAYEQGIAGTPPVLPSTGYAGSGDYQNQPVDPCKADPTSKGYGAVYSKPYDSEKVGCTIFSRQEDYKRRVCDGAEVLVRGAYRTGESAQSTEAGCRPSTGGSTGGGGGGGGSRGGGGGGGGTPQGGPAGEPANFANCTPTNDGRFICNASPDQSGSLTGVVPYDPFSPSAKQSWVTDFNPSGYNANDPIMGGSYYAPSGGSPQAFTGNTASDIGIAYQDQQQNYNTFAGAWGGSTGSTWSGSGAVGGTTGPSTTSPLVSAVGQNPINNLKQSGELEPADATDANPEGGSLAWLTAAIVALKVLAA